MDIAPAKAVDSPWTLRFNMIEVIINDLVNLDKHIVTETVWILLLLVIRKCWEKRLWFLTWFAPVVTSGLGSHSSASFMVTTGNMLVQPCNGWIPQLPSCMRKQSCSRLWNLSHGPIWFPWWLTVFRSDVWKIHENDSPMKTWLKWLKTKKHVNAIFDDPLVRPCSA